MQIIDFNRNVNFKTFFGINFYSKHLPRVVDQMSAKEGVRDTKDERFFLAFPQHPLL